QNLKKRSYFSRAKKAPHFGFLSWEDSAQEIERQFRALNFGNYPNEFAKFKVFINHNVFIPGKLYILPIHSQALPGTIIQIVTQAIHVSTKTECISLSQFTDLKGNPLSIETLAKQSGIHIGDLIQNPDKKV